MNAFDEQNDYGLYNMIGNVWEWTADKFARYHDHEPAVDPKGSPRGQDYVKKGGSFLSDTEHSYRHHAFFITHCIFLGTPIFTRDSKNREKGE